MTRAIPVAAETRNIPAVSAAAGITWVNLSAAAAGHADSADNDPNSQHASFASDATGTTIGVENSVSVDGWTEGALYIIDDLVTLFPDWLEDGSKVLMIHGEVVTAAPDSKNYWQGIAVVGGSALTAGSAVKYVRAASTDRAASATTTSDTSNGILSLGILGILAVDDSGAVRIDVPGGGNVASALATSMGAGYRLALIAGCESSGDDGPHSAKVLWRAAIVSTVPA